MLSRALGLPSRSPPFERDRPGRRTRTRSQNSVPGGSNGTSPDVRTCPQLHAEPCDEVLQRTKDHAFWQASQFEHGQFLCVPAANLETDHDRM